MTHTIVVTPAGEELVLLPRGEFEMMQEAVAALRHERAMAEVASGALETLSDEEVAAALAATTPLAFWRNKRGLRQTALAEAVGISQSYLAGLEKGARKGDPALFLRLARALQVRVEDIIEE